MCESLKGLRLCSLGFAKTLFLGINPSFWCKVNVLFLAAYPDFSGGDFCLGGRLVGCEIFSLPIVARIRAGHIIDGLSIDICQLLDKSVYVLHS